jgi:hypothetical protein
MSARRGTALAFTLALAAGMALPACTFVKMGPGADAVRVVGPGQLPAGCELRGEVEVSVKNRLGPYERDEMRVRDELETLARNEAPSLSADTIQPKGPPVDGEQRFQSYRCGALSPTPVAAPARANRDGQPPAGASTAPLKDE